MLVQKQVSTVVVQQFPRQRKEPCLGLSGLERFFVRGVDELGVDADADTPLGGRRTRSGA